MDFWVKVVWKYDWEQPCWAPDLPEGLRMIAPCEIPVHLDSSLPQGRTRDGRLISPSEDSRTCYGDPIVTHCRVHIAEEDADKMKGYSVPIEEVSERDLLAVRCNAELVHKWDSADSFFDSLDAVNSDEERKLAIKDVLLQAVRRGFDPIQAEKVRVRLELPEATAIEEAKTIGR